MRVSILYAYSECLCKLMRMPSPDSVDSQSAMFSGDGFIQYDIIDSASRRRAIRQTQVYIMGRNYVSLAFITGSDTGTILLLGVDDENEEHTKLEVE